LSTISTTSHGMDAAGNQYSRDRRLSLFSFHLGSHILIRATAQHLSHMFSEVAKVIFYSSF
jgi:hypothetical protein